MNVTEKHINDGASFLKEGLPNKQSVELFNALSNFLKVHCVLDSDKLEILKTFSRKCYLSTITQALCWHNTKQGYDFFYFLALRWATYLITHAKLYDELYDEDSAIGTLRMFLSFSKKPNNGMSKECFDKKKRYYRDFLLKYY